MTNLTKIIASIMSIVAFAGIVWGAQAYLNSNFASASEVQQLEKRLDVKILEDRLFTIQERIWKIEDRYYDTTIPKDTIEQLRILNNDKELLMKELDIIKEK